MPIPVVEEDPPAEQQPEIKIAPPVAEQAVPMVAEEVNILMVLVALVGVEMGIMVVLLLEVKALPMARKAVLVIHLVMVLMADLAVAVDPTLVAVAAAAIPAAAEAIGLIPVMVVAVDPISRIRPQIPVVLPVKMKVMVRLLLLIVQVFALPLHP